MSKGWKVLIGILVVLVLALSAVVGYVLISGQLKSGIVLPIPAVVSRPDCVGTWHANAAFGGVTAVINADSTAIITNGWGDADQMSWREQGGKIYLTSSKYRSNSCSGSVSSDGKSLTLISQNNTLIFIRQ